jgi:hypothetical protein
MAVDHLGEEFDLHCRRLDWFPAPRERARPEPLRRARLRPPLAAPRPGHGRGWRRREDEQEPRQLHHGEHVLEQVRPAVLRYALGSGPLPLAARVVAPGGGRRRGGVRPARDLRAQRDATPSATSSRIRSRAGTGRTSPRRWTTTSACRARWRSSTPASAGQRPAGGAGPAPARRDAGRRARMLHALGARPRSSSGRAPAAATWSRSSTRSWRWPSRRAPTRAPARTGRRPTRCATD